MARDIVLDVLTEAKGRGLLQAANDMDRLADRADRTNRTLGEFSNDVERARTRVHDLSMEFARSSGDNIGLAADLKKARNELRQFEQVASTIGPDIGDSLGDMFAALPGEAKLAMAGVAAALTAVALPAIGAAIAGAVVGTVGLGGIAGGIAAAASDPAVKAATAQFANEAKSMFKDVGTPFVEPLVKSLHTLGDELDDLHLGDALAPLAEHLDELTAGVLGLAQGAMPGLTRAFAAAGPAVDVLADNLPVIGEALGNMIGDISESDGALQGLDMTLQLVAATLDITGKTITGLSNGFHAILSAGAAVTGVFEDMGGPLGDLAAMFNNFDEGVGKHFVSATRKVGEASVTTAASLRAQAEAARTAAGALAESATASVMAAAKNNTLALSFANAAHAAGGLSDEFDKLNGTMLNEREAARAGEEALDSFRAAINSSHGSLSKFTPEGRAAARAMDDVGKKAVSAAQSILNNGGSVDSAAKAYNHYISGLRATLSQAGFTKSAIDRLIGSIAKMPTHKTVNVKQAGAAGAKAAIDAVAAALARVNSKTVYLTTVVSTKGKIAAFAEGTPSAPPGWAWVGERGPELMKLRGGEQIKSSGQSMAMAGAGAGGGGGHLGTVRVVVEDTSGRVLQEKLLAVKRQQGGRSLGFD